MWSYVALLSRDREDLALAKHSLARFLNSSAGVIRVVLLAIEAVFPKLNAIDEAEATKWALVG
jgi:hypothetical protein